MGCVRLNELWTHKYDARRWKCATNPISSKNAADLLRLGGFIEYRVQHGVGSIVANLERIEHHENQSTEVPQFRGPPWGPARQDDWPPQLCFSILSSS